MDNNALYEMVNTWFSDPRAVALLYLDFMIIGSFAIAMLWHLITKIIPRGSMAVSKGKEGENAVSDILKKTFRHKAPCYIIDDALLQIPGSDKTAQIDHIVVSNYGIFVIETKNYCGGIYGSEYDKNWLKCVGGQQYKFYSPVAQNRGHCAALSSIIGKGYETVMVPVVAFADASDLHVNCTTTVVRFNALHFALRDLCTHKILSNAEVRLVYKSIIKSARDSQKARIEHINQVKALQSA